MTNSNPKSNALQPGIPVIDIPTNTRPKPWVNYFEGYNKDIQYTYTAYVGS